jgi:hypothetical protein
MISMAFSNGLGVDLGDHAQAVAQDGRSFGALHPYRSNVHPVW